MFIYNSFFAPLILISTRFPFSSLNYHLIKIGRYNKFSRYFDLLLLLLLINQVNPYRAYNFFKCSQNTFYSIFLKEPADTTMIQILNILLKLCYYNLSLNHNTPKSELCKKLHLHLRIMYIILCNCA